MTLDEYEGVVYDLDGTLVRLDVDWDAAREDVAELYRAAGVSPEGMDLWELLESAADHGLSASVETTVANHERVGARTARRLPVADELLALTGPVAVCSLNCEAACRIALEEEGLDSAVDVVVGRDSVDSWKPDPEPLLFAVDQLGVGPSDAVFVGDSERDAETAHRAGVDYLWAYDDGPSDR